MMLRGLKIDGEHAYSVGLVREVLPIPELKSRAKATGEVPAAQPREAVKFMLEAVDGF